MAESIVEAPDGDNKIKQSGPSLEVSISFGRFQNDSLSWEKWSSFSPNKYLEEVEKCSTPGSVAQKKAYFEAHYKMIAARKAEQLELGKQMETSSLAACNEKGEDQENSTSQMAFEPIAANAQSSAGESKLSSNSAAVVTNTHFGDSNSSAVIVEVCPSSRANGGEENADSILDRLEIGKSHEVQETIYHENTHLNASQDGVERLSVSDEGNASLNGSLGTVVSPSSLVQENTHLNISQDGMEIPPILEQGNASLNGSMGNVGSPSVLVQKNGYQNGSQGLKKSSSMNMEEAGKTWQNKNHCVDMDASKNSLKVTPPSKERNSAGLKKKPISPQLRSPQPSTPRISKVMSASPALSSNRMSVMKGNGPSRPRRTPAAETKRVASSSLHMSLSLGPANADSPSIAATRKSLIMEKMGDKDIVKRAFKTFQNSLNQVRSSENDRSSQRKQVLVAEAQQVSASFTPRKQNDGMKKAPRLVGAQRSQLGSKGNSKSPGLMKGVAVDHTKAKPALSSFGLRNYDKAEKQEVGKKVEKKSLSKWEGKTHVNLKSKEEEDDGMKKLRHQPNYRTTTTRGFYQGQGTPKGCQE